MIGIVPFPGPFLDWIGPAPLGPFIPLVPPAGGAGPVT
jgi:hypothetical protein